MKTMSGLSQTVATWRSRGAVWAGSGRVMKNEVKSHRAEWNRTNLFSLPSSLLPSLPPSFLSLMASAVTYGKCVPYKINKKCRTFSVV